MSIMAMGIVQFGVIMQTSVGLSQLSRDATRWAVLPANYASFSGTASTQNSNTNLTNEIRNMLNSNSMMKDADISATWQAPHATPQAGDLLTVYLSYDITKKVFMPNLPGMARFRNARIYAQTTMVCQQS